VQLSKTPPYWARPSVLLLVERGRVAAAERTGDEAIKLANEQIDSIARAPNPAPLLAKNGPVEFPTVSKHVMVGAELITVDVPDTAGMLAWLHRDALKKKLADEIKANASPDALPAAEREKRLRELDAEILALARREEALIELIEADGGEVIRTGEHVDYRAVLHLSDAMPAPRFES
jgi:hypothetical protein